MIYFAQLPIVGAASLCFFCFLAPSRSPNVSDAQLAGVVWRLCVATVVAWPEVWVWSLDVGCRRVPGLRGATRIRPPLFHHSLTPNKFTQTARGRSVARADSAGMSTSDSNFILPGSSPGPGETRIWLERGNEKSSKSRVNELEIFPKEYEKSNK